MTTIHVWCLLKQRESPPSRPARSRARSAAPRTDYLFVIMTFVCFCAYLLYVCLKQRKDDDYIQ